jgi:hypothetical protein
MVLPVIAVILNTLFYQKCLPGIKKANRQTFDFREDPTNIPHAAAFIRIIRINRARVNIPVSDQIER